MENITIIVTAEELELIGLALGKLPYENSAPLLQNLRQQFLEQEKVKHEKKLASQ